MACSPRQYRSHEPDDAQPLYTPEDEPEVDATDGEIKQRERNRELYD